jgi:electron transport complex protein RnfG
MTEVKSELVRITANITIFCAMGAVVLGVLYIGTNRYYVAAQAEGERTAISELLGLGPDAQVTQVEQFLSADGEEVIYRASAVGGGEGGVTQLKFTLDGELVSRDELHGEGEEHADGLKELGRIFVARNDGSLAGFVVEGEIRGYKKEIRYFISMDGDFKITGVRVVEHEEDPGLGAEIATDWFQGQYLGRAIDQMDDLEVTKDPMPEDWSAALNKLGRMDRESWRGEYGDLLQRENDNPIYAVTGATISSQALTDGLRNTSNHFRYRWALLAPHIGDQSS